MSATPQSAGQPIQRLADLEHGLLQLTVQNARMSRTICDARLRDWLAAGHQILDWRAVTEARRESEHTIWVTLRSAAGDARIGFDAVLYQALASAATLAPGELDPTVNATWRHAVGAILLGPLLDLLAELGSDDVQVVGFVTGAHENDPQDAGAILVRFTYHGRLHECQIAYVDDRWLNSIARYFEGCSVPLTPSLSEIRVSGSARLGKIVLSVRTLESLRPGDVLLRAVSPALSHWFDLPPRPIPLNVQWGVPGARQLCARATLTGTRLVLDSDPFMTQDNLCPDAAPGDDETASIDSLQLPVSIEIETVTLPLVQLSALRAAYVLELPITVRDARVRLMSYAQQIGVGELVAVGEHLGVRVIRIFGNHDSVQ